MTEYVAGFLFDSSRTRVALVLKRSPAWQAGLHNAIGGKIEPGESPLQAMNREFKEETGVSGVVWEASVILGKPGIFRVYFFRAFSDSINLARTQEAEEIKIVPISEVLAGHIPVIQNLRWLVPLQLDPCLEVPVVVNELTGPSKGTPGSP